MGAHMVGLWTSIEGCTVSDMCTWLLRFAFAQRYRRNRLWWNDTPIRPLREVHHTVSVREPVMKLNGMAADASGRDIPPRSPSARDTKDAGGHRPCPHQGVIQPPQLSQTGSTHHRPVPTVVEDVIPNAPPHLGRELHCNNQPAHLGINFHDSPSGSQPFTAMHSSTRPRARARPALPEPRAHLGIAESIRRREVGHSVRPCDPHLSLGQTPLVFPRKQPDGGLCEMLEEGLRSLVTYTLTVEVHVALLQDLPIVFSALL